MDHVVCLDEEEGDLEALRSGKKSMIALGANERGARGAIGGGDGLLLTYGPGKGTLAKASAGKVITSPPLSPGSCAELPAAHARTLALTGKQARELVGKRYLVLIELCDLVLSPDECAEAPGERSG